MHCEYVCDMEQIEQLAMAWAHTRQIQSKHKYEALTHFGSLARILRSYIENPIHPIFESIPKEPQKWLEAEKIPWIYAQHDRQDIRPWVMGQAPYPESLLDLADPPWVIYAQGSLQPTYKSSLSVIGTRRPTTYGRRVTAQLLEPCIGRGMIIISGLAYGIDGLAHQEALVNHGRTVGVLAHGLHQTYPQKHQHLRKEILAQGGLILSEYPWGQGAQKFHFHARNRIIAALSPGLLVIEAAQRSGTQITVRHAIDIGREVYAVPGCIDSKFSMYPNRLLAEGAKAALDAQSVLEDYALAQEPSLPIKQAPVLTPQEHAIWSFLDLDQPKTVDQICNEKNMTVCDVSVILSTLELQGCLEKQSDGRYVRR